MRIQGFIWNEDRIDHIARHNITPEEVEETCFGVALVQRAKSEGENPVYYVLGQTVAGRIYSVWSFSFLMAEAIQ